MPVARKDNSQHRVHWRGALLRSSTLRDSRTVKSPSRSGVFQAGTDERLEAFAESISFDRRLYRQDIRGSIAHAEMLAQRRTDHRRRVHSDSGHFARNRGRNRAGPAADAIRELEDIHMHVEQA